jgi:hypothetical protein
MNTPKAQYIQRIRTQSTYPTFRTFVGVIALLFYIIGAICILGGIIGMFAGMSQQGLGPGVIALFLGILIGLIYIVIGKLIKEASLMLADIADSITDVNSRYEQQ